MKKVRLTRRLAKTSEPQALSYVLEVEVISTEDITKNIFVKQRVVRPDGSFNDSFAAVATPTQLEELNVGCPNADTNYFLDSKVTVYGTNESFLNYVYTTITEDVKLLIDNSEALDALLGADVWEINNLGINLMSGDLIVGVDVEAWSANLDLWSLITPSAKQNALGYVPLNPSNNLSDITNAATARTNLGITGGGSGDMLSTNNLSDVANVATARTNLGLVIGTNVQAYAANLTSWAALAPSAKQDALGYTPLNAASNLSDVAVPATARTNLGLAIGTNVQAYAANLTSWAALAPSAKQDALGFTPLNAANNLSDLTLAATARTNLGLVIGTNVEAWSANLDSWSAIAPSAKQNALGFTPLNPANNLSDVALAATARTNLGLAIGTNVQAYAANLTSWAALATSAKQDALGFTPLNPANNLSEVVTPATARTNLGLAIGTNVQAYSANLAAWSALATSAKQDALGFTPLNAASNLSDVAVAATARTNLGLAIGTNVQAWSANLDSWSALATSAKQDALGFTAVPTTRTISTTAPITGGGDLSANRTLAIAASTNAVDGYLTAADHTTFAAKVGPTRTVATGAGLTGGGDLSADRTLVVDLSTFVNNLTMWDASQATRTWTANLSGATKPVWTYGNNSADLSTGVLKYGGNTVATSANNLSFFASTTSAQLLGRISDASGTGLAIFGTSPAITTPSITGAVTFQAGVRQTFNPNTTTPGVNVGSVAGDPSTPSNGDVWYDSTGGLLRARIAGASVSLGAGGAGLVDDTAYNATSWDGDTTHAPSKNAVRDKLEALDAAAITTGTLAKARGGAGADMSSVTFPSSGSITTDAATSTLTNKRVTLRIATLGDASSVTGIDADSYDGGKLTTLTQNSTIPNPTGTPTAFQTYVLRIKSTAVRTLTWGTQYRGSTDLALPSTTSGGSLTDYFIFRWNADDSKWDLLGKAFGF